MSSLVLAVVGLLCVARRGYAFTHHQSGGVAVPRFPFASPHVVVCSSSVSSSFSAASSLGATPTATNDVTNVVGGGDADLTSKGLLKRDRYVATNRFAVRRGKGARFEARWAKRKSRLSELQGFRYFHLMRRVTLNDGDEDGSCVYDGGDPADGSNAGNYVSFTVWERKADFSTWRKGEAFKEAHGGTSIGAFMSTMVSSAMVLKGAPRPAFYDGLLVQSTVPENVPETVDGWRSVEADGTNVLPAECFVATNQFFVPPENGPAFEQRWESRESKLKECEGFVAFSMMRRDAGAKGHGIKPMDGTKEPSYLSTTIWKDRTSFDAWRKGNAFKQAHGAKAPSEVNAGSDEGKPPQPLWSRPPEPVFYEGTLVISKPEGA